MGSLAIPADERVLDVAFDDDALSVSLRDGRVISVPLVLVPAPAERHAHPAEELANCRRGLRNPLAGDRRRPEHRRVIARRASAEGQRAVEALTGAFTSR